MTMRITRVEWHDEVFEEVAEACDAGLVAGAEAVLRAATERVPVDTGVLRDSGRVEVDGSVATVAYDAEYAASVHARRAWLREAMEDVATEVGEVMGETVRSEWPD